MFHKIAIFALRSLSFLPFSSSFSSIPSNPPFGPRSTGAWGYGIWMHTPAGSPQFTLSFTTFVSCEEGPSLFERAGLLCCEGINSVLYYPSASGYPFLVSPNLPASPRCSRSSRRELFPRNKVGSVEYQSSTFHLFLTASTWNKSL
ncbi:hypothetical protein P175DRAFT_0500988 [Aspergillus ochraceoroseus IBT 24754]|uniref:Secreted protein n=1 Tax=Aspergillus ochraceoroseus IBT 24754 TaxID=1392256 RepID=A0A2T5M0T5_9EURO|nr:uncharacterized protein P175DRAFT_0500988 [Aspergillus ochraceoroseus IBT 24754]PTU22139.1 hypothetical protein P175DRAFT_0500988 [Aspergillus ochraceoroseus IBT 24754]